MEREKKQPSLKQQQYYNIHMHASRASVTCLKERERDRERNWIFLWPVN